MTYLLFAGDRFYPYEGFYDFQDSFASLDAAEFALLLWFAEKNNPTWAHIVSCDIDSMDFQIVFEADKEENGRLCCIVYDAGKECDYFEIKKNSVP